jgi:hypothetical protein
MSDPLESLRNITPGAEAPDPQLIRERAHRIQMRRYQAVGAFALIFVLLAGFALFRPTNVPNNLAGPKVSPIPNLEQVEENAQSAPLSEIAAGQTATTPNAAEQDTASLSGSKSAVGAQGGTSGTGLRAELELSNESTSSSMPVVMRLKACNDTNSNITLKFSTSQRYDFEVKNSSDQVVWRWSADKRFQQAEGSETFSPGCRLLGEESWNTTQNDGRPAPPGSYDVTGIVTYRDPIRSAPKRVCAVTC